MRYQSSMTRSNYENPYINYILLNDEYPLHLSSLIIKKTFQASYS